MIFHRRSSLHCAAGRAATVSGCWRRPSCSIGLDRCCLGRQARWRASWPVTVGAVAVVAVVAVAAAAAAAAVVADTKEPFACKPPSQKGKTEVQNVVRREVAATA